MEFLEVSGNSTQLEPNQPVCEPHVSATMSQPHVSATMSQPHVSATMSQPHLLATMSHNFEANTKRCALF